MTDETGTREHSNANFYNHYFSYFYCYYYYCLLLTFFLGHPASDYDRQLDHTLQALTQSSICFFFQQTNGKDYR